MNLNMNSDRKSFIKFDTAYPLHTWYPLFGDKKEKAECSEIYSKIDISNIEKRALYFHIPFCEEQFCAFCSFNRKLKESEEEINKYVEALIKEIEIKAKYGSINSIPINAIFFGGGTPSVLSEKNIEDIGKAIKKNFNLTQLKEFSFENNICSITEPKLQILKKIGVTHVRAGVQSMNPKYREYFNLRPTIQEVEEKVALLNKYFENVCVDIIYGINGQTVDELILDIHNVCKLNTKLIDFYPLTQPKGNMQLYKLFSEKGLIPQTELTLIGYKTLLRDVASQYGYIPHNGHGFINSRYIKDYKKEFITREYVFEYHKCVMGYMNGDVIGFGAGAVSGFTNYVMNNENNITKYIEYINKGELPAEIYSANMDANYCRGIISHLPYFGYSEKKFIDLTLMPVETLKALENLIKVGLIYENKNEFLLSADAWAWDNIIMYYLSPNSAKKELDQSFSNNLPENYYLLSTLE